MPKLPDTAGSARARMRLAAVILLGLITVYWGFYALYLLFLPEGSPGATAAVAIGAVCLAFAGVYALVTWGTATFRRGLHQAAIVVTTLAVVFVAAASILSIVGLLPQVSLALVPWDVWILAGLNLITLLLLTQTVPQGRAR